MIKVQVLENFTLKERINEVNNLVRATAKNETGFLYVGDVFECTEELADYLTQGNRFNKAFVKVVEVIPAEKPKRKTRKTTK